MSNFDSKLVDLEVELRHETDKAWLIYDGKIEQWIPKSQAELDLKSDVRGTLTLPEWLAKEKELI